MAKVTTFLMFEGQAEEAMQLYISLIRNSEIVSVSRYGANGSGKEGTVEHAIFRLDGQDYMAIDSNVKHNFTFTPSMSLFTECESDEEITLIHEKLSEGGQVLMPMDNYGFSKKFVWFNDRFGVSWQLILR